MLNPNLLTCLATNWSKHKVGYWLCQKHCTCPSSMPYCCPTGWQTVSVGSRFCNQAEQRYAPKKGKVMAAAWAVNKCRYFLLGLLKFTLAVDHKPLVSLLGNKSLELVTNPRITRQQAKLLPYPYDATHAPQKVNVIADMLS